MAALPGLALADAAGDLDSSVLLGNARLTFTDSSEVQQEVTRANCLA